MLKKQLGFTLIELLIVVAIIAILAAIAIPNFLAAQTRAKVSTAMKDQQTIATGLESYQVDNTAYPWSSDLYHGIPDSESVRDYCRTARLARLTTPIAYLSHVPMDVFNLKGNISSTHPTWTGSWDRAYPYWEPAIFDAYKANSVYDNMFTDVPDERTKRGRWAVMSFGPDQNYSINIYVTWPGKIMHYDPTNGVVTNGDVWRFGP